MTEKPTGGPAFPSLNPTMIGIDSDGTERWETEPCGGLTMRDYFAAKAMAAHIMRHPIESGGVDYDFDHTIAEWSYAQADAMIKARL